MKNNQIDLQVGDTLNVPCTGSFSTRVLEVNDTHFRCGCVSLPRGEWRIKNTPWIDKNVIKIYDQSSPDYDNRYGLTVREGSEYEYWISPELVFIKINEDTDER